MIFSYALVLTKTIIPLIFVVCFTMFMAVVMNSVWQVFWACIPESSLKARLGRLIFHWRRLDTLVVEYKKSLLHNSYMMLRQLLKSAAEWILAEKRLSNINAGLESSIGSQEFKYEKITKSRQIRLLKLPRQKSLDEVWCEIIVVSLDHPPACGAISYTWGSSEKTHEILLSGARCAVSSVVHEILQGRRSVWTTKWLWIDSLCTNQQDDEEKSEQIQLMRDIYHNAVRVLVWLGPLDDAHLGIKFLRDLRWMINMHNISVEELHEKFKAENRNQQRLAVIKLLDHPWFNRVWIIQEAAVANDVHILVGGHYLDWSELKACMRAFGLPGMDPLLTIVWKNCVDQADWTKVGNAIVLSEAKEFIQKGGRLRLRDILFATMMCGATNPRDKVYALRGICKDADNAALIPDYSKTVQQVYNETARYLLSESDPLRILGAAGIGSARSVEGLPSWVPDWSPRVHAPLSAGYNAADKSEQSISISAVQNILTVAGMHADELKETGSVLANPALVRSTHAESARNFIREYLWYEEARILATESANNPYTDGKPLSEALWRTLVGGIIDHTRPAPPEYGKYYQENMTLRKETMHILERVAESENESLIQNDNSPVPREELAQRRKTDCDVRLASTFRPSSFAQTFLCNSPGFYWTCSGACYARRMICIFKGARVPFLLRQNAEVGIRGTSTQTYLLVGECYIHGMMDGEMMEGVEHFQEFNIQ